MPGTTLIEAYAYLVDGLFQRLNQVPDRLQLKFLDLIGLRLVPPTPATVPVTFWLSAPARSPLVVARGTETGTVRTESEPSVVFSSTADLTIPPCSVTAVMTRTAEEPGTGRPRPRYVGRAPAFSSSPRPDDELLIGLDIAVPAVAVRLEYGGADRRARDRSG